MSRKEQGEKKTLAVAQTGLLAVGIGGVFCWKVKGSEELIPELLALARLGGVCHIGFDYEPKPETQRKVAGALRRLARALRKAGVKEVLAVEKPPGPDGCKMGDDDFLAAFGPDAFRELVEKARPVLDRALVVLGTDEFRVNAEAEAALENAEGLYQRGGHLAHVVQHDPSSEKALVRRPSTAPIVRALPQALLREELTKLVDCVRLVKVKEGVEHRPASLPGHVVATIHCRGAWENVPHLEGVVTHPALLADGSLLREPGYDEKSGLLLWMPDDLGVEVSDQPTRDDAVSAMTLLGDVVTDFPFKAECHKAAWLASVLTPLARYAFQGPSPLILLDGNAAGVGKGLLADVGFLIVTGREASVMSYTNDKEELRKAITPLAMEGDEMVLLDNLSGFVGNAVLDRALTASWWKDRILGGNNQFNGPLNVTWYATGNNVYLIGDTPRRVMPIRLESPLECPEDRGDFKYPDLRKHVRNNRGELLSAALTILRAYCVADRPDQQLTPWGSFEGWTSLVRNAVVWCGLDDPGDARKELRRDSSPESIALAGLLKGIAYLDTNGAGLTVNDMLLYCHNESDPDILAFREALFVLCPTEGRGQIVNARSLGMKLHHLRGRVIGGMMLERVDAVSAGVRWRVVTQQ
ncbi:MAG TPA: DUF3854 domain-containing protein [Acidobacteriaceae bacterium]|nr:DUF3854 domain-containing protein [Acidobacteriaceae bacterium]